jgi:MarR family transcriptional regulator, organic hydroperoxide resistance regulator
MSGSRAASASLGLLVGRVEHLMTRSVEAALDGLTLEQWRVLDLLADAEGHPMSEIAAHAMVPPPTLTKIVDRLIEAALVYRRPDEADRRRILVFLSERGQERHTTLAPRVAAAEMEFVTDLDEADVAHLARLLEHLGR